MNGTYMTMREITDYGPYITKIILPLPEVVPRESVGKDTFSVHVVRRRRDTGETVLTGAGWTGEDLVESRGYCPVAGAYVSDSWGRKTKEGRFVTIEPARDFLVSELAMGGGFNVRVFCDITVTQAREIRYADDIMDGLIFDRLSRTALPCAEGWSDATSRDGINPLGYGYYVPRTGSGPHPLVIWLHGAGEGGSDSPVAYTGNKVVSFSGDKVQALFGGAYVLAPQAPTMWMDDGSGKYGRSGRSMYSESLRALIDEFLRVHGDIDRRRIYIGGCSNGGFMTMRMIIDNPGFFAAAFPVCEALYDETISDGDINAIRDTPLWFTHAGNDVIVKPEETVLPTYERLVAAGAENVHFTFFDSVDDPSGLFSDEKGGPHDFLGHFSWVPFFNGRCITDFDGGPVTEGGEEVNLQEWLSHQKLGEKNEE